MASHKLQFYLNDDEPPNSMEAQLLQRYLKLKSAKHGAAAKDLKTCAFGGMVLSELGLLTMLLDFFSSKAINKDDALEVLNRMALLLGRELDVSSTPKQSEPVIQPTINTPEPNPAKKAPRKLGPGRGNIDV